MKTSKRNMPIAAIATGGSLLLAASAACALTCVSDDCANLGYTQSASECSGVKSVRCPFDAGKYFCMKQDEGCSFDYNLDACPEHAICDKCDEKYKFEQCESGYKPTLSIGSNAWSCMEDKPFVMECPSSFNLDTCPDYAVCQKCNEKYMISACYDGYYKAEVITSGGDYVLGLGETSTTSTSTKYECIQCDTVSETACKTSSSGLSVRGKKLADGRYCCHDSTGTGSSGGSSSGTGSSGGSSSGGSSSRPSQGPCDMYRGESATYCCCLYRMGLKGGDQLYYQIEGSLRELNAHDCLLTENPCRGLSIY